MRRIIVICVLVIVVLLLIAQFGPSLVRSGETPQAFAEAVLEVAEG
jgi:hypothetical protein